VLKKRGPLGWARHAGGGQLPIQTKLLQKGVRDMVRILGARLRGTSFGACVLQVAPNRTPIIGGPLALVETGDLIELGHSARRLQAPVDGRSSSGAARMEMEARRREHAAATGRDLRGARHAGERTGCDSRSSRRRDARWRSPGHYTSALESGALEDTRRCCWTPWERRRATPPPPYASRATSRSKRGAEAPVPGKCGEDGGRGALPLGSSLSTATARGHERRWARSSTVWSRNWNRRDGHRARRSRGPHLIPSWRALAIRAPRASRALRERERPVKHRGRGRCFRGESACPRMMDPRENHMAVRFQTTAVVSRLAGEDRYGAAER